MEGMINSKIKDVIKKVVPRWIIRAVKLSLHYGNKYNCPICDYNSRDLYSIDFDYDVILKKEIIGAGKRDAGCYKCGSTDRERLVYIYLKNVLNIFELRDLNILHFAPERNLFRILKEHNFKKYICGDLFAEGYNYSDYVQNMDVLNIPYDDNSFDLVICNHILEHVIDDYRAMSELYRVLKPKGKAILQVPISRNSLTTFEDFSVTDSKKREELFGQSDHVRVYGQDYVDRLGLAGFKVERINISKEYEHHGLCLKEDIFVGSK